MLKHLKHERISDQHQEQHMRMYQLRKFFSRLQHRILVDLKIRRASEVASLQWSTIERQRCFVIWVDNVHQFIHEHRVKTLINNNFRKKNLKAGLVRLFQNMHHMQGLYQTWHTSLRPETRKGSICCSLQSSCFSKPTTRASICDVEYLLSSQVLEFLAQQCPATGTDAKQ